MMPNKDGTGPCGNFRNCVPARIGMQGGGRSAGRRMGAGIRMRRFAGGNAGPIEESEAEMLKSELNDIKKRLDELTK
ncbi:DUF5320 domain-containing protein [Candidatus Micrarchaeota archaeon]|nr:DUF5320 domain-containing protein [Candidatus Micrarchaeota archaeon]